jgi:hypothetical protein
MYSQDQQNDINKSWFISTSAGLQMSGIKSEDFISSNIAPALSISGGLWFTPEIAVQIGYQGPYFNTISDDDKHRYLYFFGEVCFNINEIINGKRNNNSKWSLIIHPGAGYFYNNYYDQPNIVSHIGVSNNLLVAKQFSVFFDVEAIMGWDIYQGDADILPRCLAGLVYIF